MYTNLNNKQIVAMDFYLILVKYHYLENNESGKYLHI